MPPELEEGGRILRSDCITMRIHCLFELDSNPFDYLPFKSNSGAFNSNLEKSLIYLI